MKKIICIILTILMIIPMFCISATASAASTTSVNGTSKGVNYYYRDSYFADNASTYNPSLSTMSYILARSGFASYSNNWSYQYVNLYNLLTSIGFTDFEVNEDYKYYPETDTMGVGMAHKTMIVGDKTYSMLAIVPRSANYEYEWENNFTLDVSGDAKGFSDSAAIIENFVDYYISKYSNNLCSNIKVWIVGYSRGAAVANLVAGHMTKNGKIGNLTIEKENLYAYTFETPRAASTDVVSITEAKSYTNIHNIISSNDIVTKVAPANWGFIHYGTNESVIPEVRTSENSDLFDFALNYIDDYFATYDENGKKIFTSETFQAKKITNDLSSLSKLGNWVKENNIYVWKPVDSTTAKQILVVNSNKTMGEFLDDLISALCIGVGSRYNYTYEIQDLIRLIISDYVKNGYQINGINPFIETLKTELQANKDNIIMAAFAGKVSVLEDIFNTIINNAISSLNIDIEAYEKLSMQIAAIIPILARTAIADIAIDGGSDIITLIDNIDILSYPHESKQVLAWLRALDPNYNPNIKSTNAKVTNVDVTVNKVTETKKILFIKTTITKYIVKITPVSDEQVKSVSYRTILIGKLTNGTEFTRDIKPSYLYVEVTDACGNVTHWEYKNGSTKRLD